jgi:hypothetical protein
MATGTVKRSTTTRVRNHRTGIHPARTRSELHDKGRTDMASSGKKKTTMAKLMRESRLRERRLDKQAKKDARKQAPAPHPDGPGDTLDATTGQSAPPGAGQPAVEPVVQALADS